MEQPNPRELDLVLTSDGVDEYKRYDCRTYVKCLDVAADRGWYQFHCNDCKAYVAPPIDDPARVLFGRAGARLLKNGHNE